MEIKIGPMVTLNIFHSVLCPYTRIPQVNYLTVATFKDGHICRISSDVSLLPKFLSLGVPTYVPTVDSLMPAA